MDARQRANCMSGIDRNHVVRGYRLIAPAGVQLALAVQWITRMLPLGNSYLARAMKPA